MRCQMLHGLLICYLLCTLHRNSVVCVLLRLTLALCRQRDRDRLVDEGRCRRSQSVAGLLRISIWGRWNDHDI